MPGLLLKPRQVKESVGDNASSTEVNSCKVLKVSLWIARLFKGCS